MCIPKDKSERTGKEVAKQKKSYEKTKELNRKPLKGKPEQQQTLEGLKKQMKVSKNEHKENIERMQTAREKGMKELKEKHEKKIKNLENAPLG